MGSMKRTSSRMTWNSETSSTPRARKKSTKCCTSSSGALAPELMPTTRLPSSHSGWTSSSVSMRYASTRSRARPRPAATSSRSSWSRSRARGRSACHLLDRVLAVGRRVADVVGARSEPSIAEQRLVGRLRVIRPDGRGFTRGEATERRSEEVRTSTGCFLVLPRSASWLRSAYRGCPTAPGWSPAVLFFLAAGQRSGERRPIRRQRVDILTRFAARSTRKDVRQRGFFYDREFAGHPDLDQAFVRFFPRERRGDELAIARLSPRK